MRGGTYSCCICRDRENVLVVFPFYNDSCQSYAGMPDWRETHADRSLLPALVFFFFFTSASYGSRTVRALCCTVYMSFSFFIFSPLLTKLVKLVFSPHC
jgi:hypothetical protein